MNPSLLALLACPRDAQPLEQRDGRLVCPAGHTYAIVDGIPVLLRDDVEQTHWVADESLASARGGTPAADPPARPEPSPEAESREGGIDPYVQAWIGATGGIMYASVINRLHAYPIPVLPHAPGGGRTLLDIGCNWGRWTIAAARRGYRAIGVDPSLQALRVARRVCRQLGVDADFVAGDARYLPFRGGSVDTAFSYSVLQHFSKDDARAAVAEIGRVLKRDGDALVQMPNRFGLRCLYHQARRGFREPILFQVRYWTPRELRHVFGAIGPVTLTVDGFFSLNAQPAEAHLLPLRFRAVISASTLLRRLSSIVPPLTAAADSLYVHATRARR